VKNPKCDRVKSKVVEETKAVFEVGKSSWKMASYILVVKMSMTQ